jgi:DNA polymerase III subunit epsilon
MREIVFDTETTGLDPKQGDRIVEIGCIELVNRVETGNSFHAYFNPGMAMPSIAEQVHGLSDAFLSDKPYFDDVVEDLLDFLGDSPLVAHNAMFDFGFLNAELENCGRLHAGAVKGAASRCETQPGRAVHALWRGSQPSCPSRGSA